MTDSMFGFVGGGRPKPLTRREIENMKKIMKKVPELKRRSDKYHEKEEKKADNEFEKKIKQI